MQLGILLAVLASVMISENAPAEPVSAAPLRLVLASGACLLVVLLSIWGSLTISRAIRAGVGDQQIWNRWLGRVQQGHLILWLAMVAVVTYCLHWPQVVRYNWHLDRVVLVRDLLILAPVWIPLLASWAVFYEVERAARIAAGRSQSGGGHAADAVGRADFVWLRARHYLGLCMLPILLLLAFQDTVTLLRPGWRESEFGWLLYLIPLVGVMLAFPQLLSRIWKTEPVPNGPLRGQLERLSRRIGVRTRDFRVWQTNHQLLNAAVTGLLPSLRYVFITDGLLALLRDDEAESVVAHELGHVRRRHLVLRMLLLALPIWALGNLQAFAPAVSDLCGQWMMQCFGSQTTINAIVIPALTIAYAVIALGKYSRLLEHDADLCVYEIGKAEVFCLTLDRLSCLSSDRRERSSWLHPSTAARVHLLQRAMRDFSFARRFRRRVNRFNLALIATWILIPVVLMYKM